MPRILANQLYWLSLYRRYRHTATSFPTSLSEQFTAPMACVARQPAYVFSYSNLRDKLAPTVLDDFTKQADFANAAPFGPGPREERLDCDRRLERDGAFPPTQLIRVWHIRGFLSAC